MVMKVLPTGERVREGVSFMLAHAVFSFPAPKSLKFQVSSLKSKSAPWASNRLECPKKGMWDCFNPLVAEKQKPKRRQAHHPEPSWLSLIGELWFAHSRGFKPRISWPLFVGQSVGEVKAPLRLLSACGSP
jgi:hypothetical protein